MLLLFYNQVDCPGPQLRKCEFNTASERAMRTKVEHTGNAGVYLILLCLEIYSQYMRLHGRLLHDADQR